MPGNDVVIEAFTELAAHYEETVDRELRQFWGLSYEEFVDWLTEVASVNAGDVVLDVATGTALIPLKLVDEVGARGRVVGLDITLAMLKHGRKSVEATSSSSRINLVCASAMAMPFVEGVFNVVICGLGMHHMDVPQVLSEMRHVLKEGGALFIAAVGARSFWKPLWVKAIIRTITWLYYVRTDNITRAWAEATSLSNVHTADEWRTILPDFGFTNIEVTESPARHRWYPCALIMRAVAGGLKNPNGLGFPRQPKT
jgi:ubiquinone/menaquinone biosynthesis C-methylase UbiE